MGELIQHANDHPLLVTGTWLMALVVLFYEIRLRSRGVFEISAGQAVQLINRGARVVDVRDAGSFAAGHIIDALHVPAEQLDAAADKRLKKNRPVVVVCESGANSGRCVAPLRKAGFDQAFSLRGGLAAWRQENLPVVADGEKARS